MKYKGATTWRRRVLSVPSVSLKKKKFEITTLVTDRHKQIGKWMRKNMKKTDHYFDIWHMAKCMF